MLKKWMYLVVASGFMLSANLSYATSCAIWLKSKHYSRYYEPESSIFNIGSPTKEIISKEFRKRHLPIYYQCGVSDYLYEMFDSKTIAYQNGKKFEWHVQKTLHDDQDQEILGATYSCAFQCFGAPEGDVE